MWKARLLDENEKEYYNAFLEQSPKGHIMQTWEWGEVKRKTGWKPLRLIVECSSSSRPAAAVLLLKRNLPLTGKSFLYAPRGPVLDLTNQELFYYLLQEIKRIAKSENAVFLKIDPDVKVGSELEKFLAANNFFSTGRGKDFESVQPRFVMRLDITPPEEEIFQGFHSKTRYNIRLAQKRGVKVKEECSKSDLEVFYEILKVTAERDGFSIRSYSYYETLWKDLIEKGLANLFMAYYNGQAVSGTIAFIFGDKAWYVYGASDNEHRKHMPNYLLQWHMISWAKKKDCRIYDFRGISGDFSPHNPLYGLYRFKKGFNPEIVEFIGEYDLPFSNFYYQLWSKVGPFAGAALRRIGQLKRRISA